MLSRYDVVVPYFLVLSYSEKIGWYQLHQFPLVLPDPNSLKWEFTSKKVEEVNNSKRLVGSDTQGILFEWYGESGGQLKYYPFAKDAIWASDRFQLEPLTFGNQYGIIAKAEIYFQALWEKALQE